MKRIITHFLISLTVLSFAVGPLQVAVVHADVMGDIESGKGPAEAVGAVTPNDGKGTKQASAVACEISNLTACLAWVTYIFLSITSYFVGISGLLLNYVVQDLVVQFGQKTGILSAITQTWIVFRDLANVALVFLMLLIGVATILRVSTYGYKQLLWRVVVAALLVNFSLYFTKVVIDITNVFASETYNMILQVGSTNIPGNTDSGACAKGQQDAAGNQLNDAQVYARCYSNGFAGVFMSAIGISKFFSGTTQCSTDTVAGMAQGGTADAAAKAQDLASSFQWNLVYISLLGTVFMLIITFVFLAAALMLITRFLMFIFLMIVSPIAFVGLIAGRGFGKLWWNKLLNYAIFAPAFFLLTWIAVYIMLQMSQLWNPPTITYACAALGNITGGALLIFFAVSIGMMIAALLIARQLGMYGGAMVYNAGKGLAFMGAGYVGAYSLGAASRGMSHVYTKFRSWSQNKEVEKQTALGAGSRALARGVQNAAAFATLGLASDKVVKNALQAGYKHRFLGRPSLEEHIQDDRRRASELVDERHIDEASRIMNKLAKDKNYEPTPEESRILHSLNQRELKRATKTHLGAGSYLGIENVMDKLSDSQLNAIQENKESHFTEQERKSAEDWVNRFENTLMEAVDSTDINKKKALIAEVFGKITPAKLAQVQGRLLVDEEVIKHITKAQLDAIGRAGKLRENRAGFIRYKIETGEGTEAGEAHPLKHYWDNPNNTIARVWADPYNLPNSNGEVQVTDSVRLRREREAATAQQAAQAAQAANRATNQQQAQAQPTGGQTPPPPNNPAGTP